MQDLFTQLNPAEAAFIATVFSALLILPIILSVRAYFYQAHAKQQAEQLKDSYKSHKEAIDENLRLKTENEFLTTRCTNLLASLHEMEHRNEKNKALLVEQEKIHQTAVENAAKYAICEAWLRANNYEERKDTNYVLYCLQLMNATIERKEAAMTKFNEAQSQRYKFYHRCKQFVDQNNLVENSAQRSDNVVIEALHSLAGKVINSDKEIGRIRAEFEKYGAKFKTRTNTSGQVAEKLATMGRKTTALVMAASRIPRVGQVPREAFANLMKAAADLSTVKAVNPEVREGGVCS